MVETRSQEIARESVAIRDYFEALRKADLEAINRRFVDSEKAVNAALAAADKAVVKAEAASEKRADASNEIRGAMLDQQKAFPTKPELAAIERRVSVVEEAISRAAGRSTGTATSSELAFRVIAAIAAVAVIADLIYRVAK